MIPSVSSAQELKIESGSTQQDNSTSSMDFSLQTTFGSALVTDAVPSEDYEVWVAGFAGYAVDQRYYEIVHESLRDQFAHYYLLLKDGGGMTRAIQPFLIVSQDLATGTPSVIRNLLATIRRRFPGFLKLRMLMVGCSAGEGDIVLEKQSRDITWTIDSLEGSLPTVARRLKAMLIVFKDFPKIYR